MGRPKQRGNAPAGWTEQGWVAEQERWRTDPMGAFWWVRTLRIKNEKGVELEWRDRKFLVDILCDMHPLQVTRKCSQVGLSTIMILKAHFMAQVKGKAVIYTMPTRELLWEFSDTKMATLIEQNPYVQPNEVYTKAVHKYRGGSYVIFRGTKGDSQDISLTADILVVDEADRSDLQVVEGLESRLMASDYKGQWWFTNPSRPNVGTDLKWQKSDKMYWHVVCPDCGLEQYLTYWDNIDKERRVRCCRACRAEITADGVRDGRWLATDNGQRWRGRHIDHLMAAWISADEIIEAEETKSKDFFYNFMLGLPVIGEGISVERSLIMQNVVPAPRTGDEPDPRWKLKGSLKYMGVDVGGPLHVVIGDEHGARKLAHLDNTKDKTKWQQLEDLMHRESVNLCVIDNLPADGQAELQRNFPYKVLRCIYDYNDKRKADYEVDRQKGVVHVHRTRAIDALLDAYGKGEMPIFLADDDPLLDGTGKGSRENCLTHHWEALYQVGADGSDENTVKKDRMGNVIRRWDNAGPDHFAHANVYYYIARAVGGTGGSSGSFMLGEFKGAAKGARGKESDEDEFEDEVGGGKTEVGFYS